MGGENTDISTQWVMRMDADEELTNELADEIEKKLPVLDEKEDYIESKVKIDDDKIKPKLFGIQVERKRWF